MKTLTKISQVLFALIVILSSFSFFLTTKTYKANAEFVMPIVVTFLDPAWGTVYTQGEIASVTATVTSINPLEKIVFQLNTGQTKIMCKITSNFTGTYTCSYRVPYTGKQRWGRATSGYGVSVYGYDQMGNTGMQVLQLWSNSAR